MHTHSRVLSTGCYPNGSGASCFADVICILPLPSSRLEHLTIPTSHPHQSVEFLVALPHLYASRVDPSAIGPAHFFASDTSVCRASLYLKPLPRKDQGPTPSTHLVREARVSTVAPQPSPIHAVLDLATSLVPFTMPVEVHPNTPLAEAIISSVQPKLLDVGWGTGGADDAALAEYIVLMLVNGKTQEEIASDISGELLNLGPDDPVAREFASWLFQEVEAINSRLHGAPAPQEAAPDAMQISGANEDQSTAKPGDDPVISAYVPFPAPPPQQ